MGNLFSRRIFKKLFWGIILFVRCSPSGVPQRSVIVFLFIYFRVFVSVGGVGDLFVLVPDYSLLVVLLQVAFVDNYE